MQQKSVMHEVAEISEAEDVSRSSNFYENIDLNGKYSDTKLKGIQRNILSNQTE